MSDDAFERLRGLIRAMGRAAVAFSGGVDSTLLCRVARDELGEGSAAVTIVSPMLPRSELAEARSLAARIGIRHLLVEEGGIDPEVAANPKDRCYRCKRIEFGAVARAAAMIGIGTVLDGSNLDDLGDYRPGLRALEELGIRSPLREAGLGKKEIREISRRLGLPTWDKPAFACLASRVPYGEPLTVEKLDRIDRAEEYLRGLGLRQVRVRSHGDLARIEVAPEERVRLCDPAVMDGAAATLRALGFLYVCMELAGYEMGSLNRVIGEKGGGTDG
jgi:pyridinium-3,5-biscarboxylic acid mononucleotide sulfurtransferase